MYTLKLNQETPLSGRDALGLPDGLHGVNRDCILHATAHTASPTLTPLGRS
jgi:hypothetical protein